MQTWPGARMRDLSAQETRFLIQDVYGWAPFPHQAAWFAAADGRKLAHEQTYDPDTHEPSSRLITEDCDVLLREWEKDGGSIDWAPRLDFPSRLEFKNGASYWLLMDDQKRLFYALTEARRRGVARVLALLGAFKIGKSDSTGLYLASHHWVPALRAELIGDQYSTCEGEFEALKRFLVTERGLNVKATWADNYRTGNVFLRCTDTDALFQARTWREAQALEGKERDIYVYSEAYQLPGMMVYDGLSQNLDMRDGTAVFPTTRKRPWIEVLHKRGHGGDPRFDHFHCTCDVDREANPFTFSERTRAAAEATMTRETYAVHWKGRAGTWLGSVYEFMVGDRQMVVSEIMPAPEIGALQIPDNWIRWAGIDLGTHHAAGFVVFDTFGNAYVVAEVLNYRYVSGEIEFLHEVSYEMWAQQVKDTARILGGRWRFFGDLNLQMRRDLALHHSITIEAGIPDLELRTDIARQYFQHNRILFAPYLKVIPEEVERAKYPPVETKAGYYRRVKGKDHGLDTVEHVLGKQGKGKMQPATAPSSPIRELMQNQTPKRHPLDGWDPHVGRW